MANSTQASKKDKDVMYRRLVNPNLMDELKQQILDIVVINKKYKDPTYSAKQLSKDLNVNTRYVSAVFSVKFHMNYTSFVNKFRIEEAMDILRDARYSDLNIADVGEMVGFSCRQAFYLAFQKMNGMTPREYRKNRLSL